MDYSTKYRNVKNAGFALPAESGGRALKSALHRENRKSCRTTILMEKRNALNSDFTDNKDPKISNKVEHENRQTKFLKWKEEKQKRRLIEKAKKKPIFKVFHLSPKPREEVKSVRVTRSMAKAFSSVKSKIDTGLSEIQTSKATRSTRKKENVANKLPTVYDFKPPKLINVPQLTKPKGRNPNIKSTIKKSAKKQNNFEQIFSVKNVSMKDSTFFENRIESNETIQSPKRTLDSTPNFSKKTSVQKVKQISSGSRLTQNGKTSARKLSTFFENEIETNETIQSPKRTDLTHNSSKKTPIEKAKRITSKSKLAQNGKTSVRKDSTFFENKLEFNETIQSPKRTVSTPNFPKKTPIQKGKQISSKSKLAQNGKTSAQKLSTFFENEIDANETIQSPKRTVSTPNSSKKTPIRKVKISSESKLVRNEKTPAEKDSTFFGNKIESIETIQSPKRSVSTPNSSKKTPIRKVKISSESKLVRNEKTPARKLDETYCELDEEKGTTPENETEVDTEIIYSPFVTTARGKGSARNEWKLRKSIGNASDFSTPLILNTSIKTPSPQQEQLAAAKYFDTVLDNEISRLLDECEKWTKIKEAADFPDNQELKDEIDSVIGQTRLLVNNKFKQFRGLINMCREGTGIPPVMNKDLQGFWDMIYMQVEKIDLSYKKLTDLQKNNWIDESVIKPVKKKPTTNAKKGTKAVPSKIKAAIQAARQKKMMQQTDSTNTFDGVFFSVRTPQKSELPRAITPGRSSVRKTLLASVLSAQAQKHANVRLSSSPGLSVMRATNFAKSFEKELSQCSPNSGSFDLTENGQETSDEPKRRSENSENIAPNMIASPKDKSTKKSAIRRSMRISVKFDAAPQSAEDLNSTPNLISWSTPEARSNKKRSLHQVKIYDTPNLIDRDSPKLKRKSRCSKRLSTNFTK